MKINSLSGDLRLQEDYNLTCAVMGAEKLNPMISYEWTGTRNEDQLDSSNSVLSFTPFKLSHAGNYGCVVNITSNYIEDIIMITSDIESLLIQSKLSLFYISNVMSIYTNLDSPGSCFRYYHE